MIATSYSFWAHCCLKSPTDMGRILHTTLGVLYVLYRTVLYSTVRLTKVQVANLKAQKIVGSSQNQEQQQR